MPLYPARGVRGAAAKPPQRGRFADMSSARTIRPLAALQNTGSTKPFFQSPVLNTSIVVKHKIRPDERYLFAGAPTSATKLIVPFHTAELGLGARALFVGQRGWEQMLRELCRDAKAYARDRRVIELLDALPSLDPFLLREHFKTHEIDVAACYFAISPADCERMEAFVSSEIAKLIELAYAGRADSGDEAAKLVQILLSTQIDERLEPLRITLNLEGDAYREGVFSWKGFLYYKWVLNSLWPKLKEVLIEVMKLRVIGPRDRDLMVLIDEMKLRLRAAMENQVKAVMGYLKTYDQVFAQLTEGNAIAFRDFLLASPEMFMALGEGAGTLSHVATFWRYRFPQGKPLMAPMGEILELLQDFEAGLGAEPHPLSYAA
jgi:hypothetical protein